MARAQSGVEQLIRKRVADHPDAPWVRFGDDVYSWADALAAMEQAATGYLELGVRPGDRVAIMMRNRPEFLWAHFGLGLIGASSVLVNTAQRGRTLEHILADARCTAVVADAAFVDPIEAVRPRIPTLRHLVVADGGKGSWPLERLLDQPAGEPDVELDEPVGGLAGIMYTSGTTGPPKGVVTTGYDLTPMLELLKAFEVQPGETIYTCLPLFHGNALGISTVGSIVLDAQIAYAERFSASRLWDDCRRYGAVEFNTLGGMITMLLKQPPRPDDRENPVRTVVSAACPEATWREFEERFGVRIVEVFGMVDAPGFLLNDIGKVGSMGRPIGGVEYRVVDESDQPLGPHQVGELVFRHPKGQLTEYNSLPDATAQAYRGGWFHSGDLAEHDVEGFFYYRGGKKESMRRRGENVSAWEIESVVIQQPAVLECAAHSVPSELGEDEIKLVVVPKPGETIDPVELLDFCVGKMAYYAIPRYVEVLDEIPKTGTQRVEYATLRQRGISPATWDREAAGYEVLRV